MNRRHDSYEDYCKEIDEDAELKAHLADECEWYCQYCKDEEQASRDIDELAEHINEELESEAAKWRDAEERGMKERTK